MVHGLKTYKASSPATDLRVFFLVHDTSLEEQKYLSALGREKKAFEELIMCKSRMYKAPTDLASPAPSRLPMASHVSPFDSNSLTRRAGGGRLAVREVSLCFCWEMQTEIEDQACHDTCFWQLEREMYGR